MHSRLRAPNGTVVRPKTDAAYEELISRGYEDLDAPKPPKPAPKRRAPRKPKES